ncbi:MAG: peptidase [Rhodobacteraceae bacterium]|nr:peptidase [Paracoccaceae bacterium]
MKTSYFTASVAGAALSALAGASFAQDTAAVATTYSNIAAAAFADSVTTGLVLQSAIDALIAAPSDDTLTAARAAWLASRTPYMQTEVFRFGNAIVDDWEGKVNAWPLDEGLIDYVDAGYYFGSEENAASQLNVVASASFMLSGADIDASVINAALLEDVLQEADGNEANVATGYHAIEFLLWGQDLIADAPQAGQRPYTDFAVGDDCTGGNCDRRVAYLKAATDLLVSDLEWMAAQWVEGGEGRATIMGDTDAAITAMLTGMGSLAFGELAGERIKLGLLLHDPEEEHDCFSDDTPSSHYGDILGISNVYLGSYTRIDGTEVSGPGLSSLVAAADPALDAVFRGQANATLASADALKVAAAGGMSYDMMLQSGNTGGGAMITAVVENLVSMSHSIERISTVLGATGVTMEGSDALDGSVEEVFE